MIALRLALALSTVISSTVGAQDRPLFEVVESVGTLRYLKANRAGVSGWNALRSLERLGVFTVRFELPELRKILEKNTMSLSFDRMEAVAIAELCSVAAGLDLMTERQPSDDGKPGQLVVTIVRAPSKDNAAGRQRLLDWGLRWYRNLLETELARESTNADAEAKIRIDAALLDMARGNWSAAAGGFRWLADTNPNHPWVPEALLREAECRLAAGEFAEAGRRAARVMKVYRTDPVGVRAAIVFARAGLIEERRERDLGRYLAAATALDSVVVQLELFIASFKGRDEYPALLLQLAEAHRRRGKPDLVLDALARLEAIVNPLLLPADQWASTSFLRGCALLNLGSEAEGRERLWHFLRIAPSDDRTGIAWLTLAEAALSRESTEAMFAARKAQEFAERLTSRERSRAMVVEAKAAMQLGDVGPAVEKLVAEIRRQGPRNVPDLVVEVAEALLNRRKYERVKAIVEPLARERGKYADRARVLILEAESRQGQSRAVVRLAKSFAARTDDYAAQSRIAQLAGDAYRELGMQVEAAQAYDGSVR